MKRIAGSFLLLAGLSGCISVTISPRPPEPTANEVKSPPPVTQAMASQAGPDPTYAHWQPDPGHFQNGSVVDFRTTWATPPSQPAPLPNGLVASAAPLVQPLPPAPRPATCRLGDMPSLLPVVVTPPREPDVAQTSCGAPQETSSEKSANDMPDTQAQRWSPVPWEQEPRPTEALDSLIEHLYETPVPAGIAKGQFPVPPVPIVKDLPTSESNWATDRP